MRLFHSISQRLNRGSRRSKSHTEVDRDDARPTCGTVYLVLGVLSFPKCAFSESRLDLRLHVECVGSVPRRTLTPCSTVFENFWNLLEYSWQILENS